MRVTLLHYAAPPVIGGVEAVMARQANYFLKAGRQVVILPGRGEAWDRRLPVHIIPLAVSRHPQILAIKQILDQGIIPENLDVLVTEIEKALEPHLRETDVLIAHNVATQHKNLPLTIALQR